MEQYTENQYDDDLTVETDQYDDSYYTDADDIFDLSTSEESPIGRLKSLILSIDWEITDEVLLQFNEELLDLRDIWAGEKINLIYVQALEKISKYIYHKKAESHPSAIKLLLTLYHNLEKIVSTPDLSQAEKNATLLEDVKRFEGLKKIIAGRVSKATAESKGQIEQPPEVKPSQEEATVQTIYSPVDLEELTNLKAIVLGIEWEIRDQDIEELQLEVGRLEKLYVDSKPRLILLQGIRTLGSYIRLKKTEARTEAFKVLQYFYESLEKIVATPMTREQEKETLFPAVEMFNSFKTLLGPTISSDEVAPSAPEEDEEDVGDEYDSDTASTLTPALSGFADDEEMGFQADEEARDLEGDNFTQVDSHVDGFFAENQWLEEEEPEVEVHAPEEELTFDNTSINFDEASAPVDVDKATALQGVDVEEDDEDDELEESGKFGLAGIKKEEAERDISEIDPVAGLSSDIAPALDETEDAVLSMDLQEDTVSLDLDDVETPPDVGEEVSDVESSLTAILDKKLDEDDVPAEVTDSSSLSVEDPDDGQVLAGVDVYSEADDDSEEEPLLVVEGDLAPALVGALEDDEVIEDDEFLPGTGEVQTEDEILSRVDGFFTEPESPVLDDQEFADKSQLTEETGLEPFEPFEPEDQGPVVSETEHVLEETVPFEQEDLAEEVFVSPVTADPEEELLSFTDDVEAPGFLSNDEADPLKESDNLELEDSIEAFFTDTSEAESFDDELEIEVDTEIEEFEDELPGVIADTDELEIDIDPVASEYSELAEEDRPAPVGQDDVDEVETIGEKLVTSIPAFKLATPQVRKPVGLVDEADRQHVESLDLGDEREEALISAEKLGYEDQDAAPGVVEEGEEEVVFELVEEDEEGLELLSSVDGDTGVDIEESAELFEVESKDPLSSLQLCIDSLGLELEDKTFSGMQQAIHSLRLSFIDKPVEKTLVELIATVTQHIEKHRAQSSDSAHTLLRSVYEALRHSGQNDAEINQEQLFIETCKVLSWQQDLLEKKSTNSTPEQEEEILVEFDDEFMESDK